MSQRLINFLKFLPIIFVISFFIGSRGVCSPHDKSLSIFIFAVLSFSFLFSLKSSVVLSYAKIISIDVTIFISVISFLCVASYPNVLCTSGRSFENEAKIQLASIYSVEAGAMADDEHYSSCLLKKGYVPEERSYYIIGFASLDETSLDFIKKTKNECPDQKLIVPSQLLGKNTSLIHIAFKHLKSELSKNHYRIYAVGNIGDATHESELDIWSINEKKELIRVQDGRPYDQRDFIDKVKIIVARLRR